MNMILSPSTTCPLASTAKTLSPSPSKANPTSTLFSFTNLEIVSIFVEPTLSLILIPFGWQPIVSISASKSPKINGATPVVAPLAQSNAILILDKSPEIDCLMCWTYFWVNSLPLYTFPIFSKLAFLICSELSINDSISNSSSSVSLNPSGPKILIPLSW